MVVFLKPPQFAALRLFFQLAGSPDDRSPKYTQQSGKMGIFNKNTGKDDQNPQDEYGWCPGESAVPFQVDHPGKPDTYQKKGADSHPHPNRFMVCLPHARNGHA